MDSGSSIRTKRLLLRPIARRDGDALLPLIRNWNVVCWLAVVPWPYEAADMMQFIDEIAMPRAAGPHPVYTVLLDSVPIGTAECRGEAPADGALGPDAGQLGYWLGEPYWGRGFATEMAAALVAHTFANSQAPSIRSGVFAAHFS